MATLTVQGPSLSVSSAVAYVAAGASGDAFLNDGKTSFHVKNGGATGGAITVTVTSQDKCSEGFTHSLTASVTGGTDWLIGPFSPSRFNDANGLVQVTYSGVVTVTVAPIHTS